MKKILGLFMSILFCVTLAGCGSIQQGASNFNGHISGNTYTIDTFDYYGNNVLRTHGDRIDVSGNIVQEETYESDGSSGYVNTLSSVITLTIDGSQMLTCGDTTIFYEDGLVPDYDFSVDEIESESDSIADAPIVSGVVNSIKNKFGKPVVVVIKSQMGVPIYAFSGKRVTWTIPADLPKFTKLMVDGKALYLHRANFQIIDLDLID